MEHEHSSEQIHHHTRESTTVGAAHRVLGSQDVGALGHLLVLRMGIGGLVGGKGEYRALYVGDSLGRVFPV